MVSIDKEACIGCGVCAATAPDCFILDEEEMKAKVKPGCKCDAKCKEAVENCPVDAISI